MAINNYAECTHEECIELLKQYEGAIFNLNALVHTMIDSASSLRPRVKRKLRRMQKMSKKESSINGLTTVQQTPS